MENSSADDKIKRHGRGRVSKSQEVMSRLAIAHDPRSIGEMVFGHRYDGFEIIEEQSIEDKMSRIAHEVENRLKKAMSGVEIRLESDGSPDIPAGRLRPWMSGKSAKQVIERAEAEFYANERVISALVEHLTRHLLIAEDLRSMADSARQRAIDELNALPAYVVEFANRLLMAGIEKDKLKNMSRSRLDAVVTAIRAEPQIDGHGDIGEKLADSPAGYDRSSICETGLSGKSSTPGSPENAKIAENGSLAQPKPDPATSDPALDEGSSGLWDRLDLGSLSYGIVERIASTDEEREALRFRLPHVKGLHDLAFLESEHSMAEQAEERMNLGMLERLLNRWTNREETELSKEERLLWGFLMLAIPFSDLAAEKLPPGMFHGLLLPGRTGRGKWVRQVISLDVTDEVRANQVREAGAA